MAYSLYKAMRPTRRVILYSSLGLFFFSEDTLKTPNNVSTIRKG